MYSLAIIGEMVLPLSTIREKWSVVNVHLTSPRAVDAMFVAYNQRPLPHVAARVYGTNMSRPLWADQNVVTTRDIPRGILMQVTPTAEHALGLALALHRNLIPASREPLADRSKFLAPKMLSRMTAGILGMGRIGNMLCHYLTPLMGSVCWYDPMGSDLTADEVLSSSDILFLCCPSPPFGNPMGIDEFNIMPRGALIVNIAQPDLLNWDDVFAALGAGLLRGVASDVFPESVAHRDILVPEARGTGKLLLTPHIAGSTRDARAITEEAILDVMMERLDA